MSKIRTKKLNTADGLVIPEAINDNTDEALEALNGLLGQQNMPVNSVTAAKMAPLESVTFPTSGVGIEKIGSRGVTQAYFSTRRDFDTVGTMYAESVLDIDLDADTWSRGWNNLQNYAGFGNFPMTFEAREGMLSGCAVVDWQHGVQEGSDFAGFDWWTEVGVFVNNILIARSGEIHPRRHTTQVPFSVPVGSQNCTVDVRLIINTFYTAGVPSVDSFSTNFHIFGASVWCRNTYR